MVNFLTSLRIAPKISRVYQLSAAWRQVVEAASRRSYASRGVSHPKAALGRPPKFFGDGVEVGLVCGDLGSFG